DLWRWHEGGPVDDHRNPRATAPLGGDGEASVGVASGLGDETLGDLPLKHQRKRCPPRRPGAAEPSEQQCSADIVGKVGDDVCTLTNDRTLVDLERVAFD